MLTSSLAAYAFAKIRFAGSRLVFAVFLATLIIPDSVYLIPNFIMITRFGWYDTLAGLTVPFMASAFYIFLLRQFFAQLPNELLESARIDGAGHARSFSSIVLPLSGAPLFTVAFLAFVGSWNSLQWPLVATRTARWRPITVGLTTFITEAGPAERAADGGRGDRRAPGRSSCTSSRRSSSRRPSRGVASRGDFLYRVRGTEPGDLREPFRRRKS